MRLSRLIYHQDAAQNHLDESLSYQLTISTRWPTYKNQKYHLEAVKLGQVTDLAEKLDQVTDLA